MAQAGSYDHSVRRASEANGRRSGVSRRQAIALLGGGAALTADGLYLGSRPLSSSWAAVKPATGPSPSGYAPDGTAGAAAAFPLSHVRLLDGPFSGNQRRNLDYLLFLDPNRMLRAFRLNYGQRVAAPPIGGWESPDSRIRGHVTGHLLSGLALSYASTKDAAAKVRAEYLVRQLAALQQLSPRAGYSTGYLSAFPETYFDWLESGQYDRIWSPYYMIHKYLAGMIDAYQLAGIDQALDVAMRLADWVDERTARLTYAHMQQIVEVEFGGLPEALVNLYSITGRDRYLDTAQRFYHARFLDPLAAGEDNLAGEQCNVNTPKIIAALRMWEETSIPKYRDIAQNFWRFASASHTYVIGGQGDHEHWTEPGVIAAALSNYTCEGCVTYNMLKLTRLLHFHDPTRTDLPEYYERALFNHLLGAQDPRSPHGFVCYYTGLSAGAFKQQPLNYFPRGDPDVYATDYDTFTCDTATSLETQAKFGDSIYGRDASGVYVNLFIPSEVRCADQGLTLRQETGFPDDPSTKLTVTSGDAVMLLRIRAPGWIAAEPRVVLNGTPLRIAASGGWIVIGRRWQAGDEVTVTLPMRLAFRPAPDDPTAAAVTYGPVVLSGLGAAPSGRLPVLDTASVRRVTVRPMTFTATAGTRPVTLVPVSRAQHEHFSVYWRTALETYLHHGRCRTSASRIAGSPTVWALRCRWCRCSWTQSRCGWLASVPSSTGGAPSASSSGSPGSPGPSPSLRDRPTSSATCP
jgi:hypothetical protein